MIARKSNRLTVLLIAGLASIAIPPSGSVADPYAPAFAPWNGQFPGDGFTRTDAPELLLSEGDQALVKDGLQRRPYAEDLAMDYYNRALIAATRSGKHEAAAQAALRQALLCFERVDVNHHGVNFNKQITSYFQAKGANDVVLILKIRLGDVFRARRDLTLAEAQYDGVVNEVRQNGRGPELARDYFELARAFFSEGEFAGALRSKHKGEQLDADAPDRPDLDAQLAELDKKALEVAGQIISEKNKAEAQKAPLPPYPAGIGAMAPTGSIGGPTGVGPTLLDQGELCRSLREYAKGRPGVSQEQLSYCNGR